MGRELCVGLVVAEGLPPFGRDRVQFTGECRADATCDPDI
jgi:hypothetical protein